ncbi:hypothetical protein [Bacillus sp. FF-1]|uniref:hypothetical protein n=1 Tax=Bacillus sp. FF-1 TaxID=3025192 RepID=UPI00234EF002|nr:hypothetical protein [Bacillus sp. FF-1]MDC7739534.1 hypothetical protein [Bacillus sp. FF-1]
MINTKKIVQNNNRVDGDLIAGDKKVYIQKEIARAAEPIRENIGFEMEADGQNTVLIKKLKDGKVNATSRTLAIGSKIKSLQLLLKICKTQKGRQIVADIYANLMTVINMKYLAKMEEGELLKTSMDKMYVEFTDLVRKYDDLIEIDESFIEGLLYIATSNCALRWKVEEDEAS